MFNIFSEEIEVLIKNGIANLYWYKDDLRKAWVRSGVEVNICKSIFNSRTVDGSLPSKRELMNMLYDELQKKDYNKRLEISRNFVRILIEHKSFIAVDRKHRIHEAELAALKLKQIISDQEKSKKESQKYSSSPIRKESNYNKELQQLYHRFIKSTTLSPQEKGYELERIFLELMKISDVQASGSFKIVGEQIDGAIKHDGSYYLVELKWTDRQIGQAQLASHYLKVEGKMGARGIFISMGGYSRETLESLPKGKTLKVLLFDGMHLTNVLSGLYTFQELLDHAIEQATLKGEIYCNHEIN